MLAEEGYIGVALDLFGAETILDEMKIIERKQVFFIKIEKNLEKELRVDK